MKSLLGKLNWEDSSKRRVIFTPCEDGDFVLDNFGIGVPLKTTEYPFSDERVNSKSNYLQTIEWLDTLSFSVKTLEGMNIEQAKPLTDSIKMCINGISKLNKITNEERIGQLEKSNKIKSEGNNFNFSNMQNSIDQLRKDVDGLMNGKYDTPFVWWKPHIQETTSAVPISDNEYRMDENTKPERFEKIVCAAKKFIFNRGFKIVGGVDYESIYNEYADVIIKGFLTSKNRFVDDNEAYQIHSKARGHYGLSQDGILKPEDLL
jgi:hypothetical protein